MFFAISALAAAAQLFRQNRSGRAGVRKGSGYPLEQPGLCTYLNLNTTPYTTAARTVPGRYLPYSNLPGCTCTRI